VRQCRARNLRHIMRYQLALLCPGFDPLPQTGQLRRRRPRRGKRRAHRPKHRPSVPTQLRLRSDYIPTTTHYTSPQPCLQATYTRPTETVITTYKVSNMRAIPNCSRPPPVGRYLSSRQLNRLASGYVLDEYCYATIAMDEPVDRPIHRLTHRQRKRICVCLFSFMKNPCHLSSSMDTQAAQLCLRMESLSSQLKYSTQPRMPPALHPLLSHSPLCRTPLP